MHIQKKQALMFGIFYATISMAIEIVFFTLGFTLEKHAGIIGATLLIITPLIAAYIANIRSPKELVPIYILTIIFTVILVALFGQITEGGIFGPLTTIIKPLLIRIPSGFMAVFITRRFRKG